MENKNAEIYVTSVGNISKRLEYYGDVDITKISLLKLIYKYACYSVTYSQLQRLNTMVSWLQTTSPYICLEKQAQRGADYVNPVGVVAIDVGGVNIAPTITDNSFNVSDSDQNYTFTTSDIYSGFSDPNGNLPGDFVIKSLPTIGTLTYNGQPISINSLYPDPTLLVYTRANNTSYVDTFTWSVYDDEPQVPLESNTATMTGNIEEIINENEPPTIGDRADYAANRATTIFSVADFTTETIAPYYDPENNELDAIRIDEISDANTGIYYYYGNPVTEGQVITASELESGVFYHVGPDSNSISTDSFNASVRDNVNLTWVS